MQEIHSAQARAAASETRNRPSRITLAMATSTNPAPPGKCRPLQGTAPTPPGQVGGCPDCRQPLRRQRGRLALGRPVAPANAQEGRRRHRTGGGGEAGELVRLDPRAPGLADAG